jgi:hypothetical protein
MHGTGSLACQRRRRLRHCELAYSGLLRRLPPGFVGLTCADIHLACTCWGVPAMACSYSSATPLTTCHPLLLYSFARAVSDEIGNGEYLAVSSCPLLSVKGYGGGQYGHLRGGQYGHGRGWPIWPRLGTSLRELSTGRVTRYPPVDYRPNPAGSRSS